MVNNWLYSINKCSHFLFLIIAIIFLNSISIEAYAQVSEKPNIIYILADDLGYGDIQYLNPNSKIPTPNIDKLAIKE